MNRKLKFMQWMAKIGNIHYTNTEAMELALEKIENDANTTSKR